MTRPTHRAIIQRALDLLGAGILLSVLPSKLMEEFDLSVGQAGRLAGEAIRRHKQEQLR